MSVAEMLQSKLDETQAALATAEARFADARAALAAERQAREQAERERDALLDDERMACDLARRVATGYQGTIDSAYTAAFAVETALRTAEQQRDDARQEGDDARFALETLLTDPTAERANRTEEAERRCAELEAETESWRHAIDGRDASLLQSYDRLAVQTEQIVKLKAAVDELSVCTRCRGKGTVYKACTLCGDSTYDHMCNDDDVPCPQCKGTGCRLAAALEG